MKNLWNGLLMAWGVRWLHAPLSIVTTLGPLRTMLITLLVQEIAQRDSADKDGYTQVPLTTLSQSIGEPVPKCREMLQQLEQRGLIRVSEKMGIRLNFPQIYSLAKIRTTENPQLPLGSGPAYILVRMRISKVMESWVWNGVLIPLCDMVSSVMLPGVVRPKEAHPHYRKQAEKLWNTIASCRNVRKGSQMSSWIASFRLLEEKDGFNRTFVDSILSWYCKVLPEMRRLENHGYLPVVWSGASFRKKIFRIEDAYKRWKMSGTGKDSIHQKKDRAIAKRVAQKEREAMERIEREDPSFFESQSLFG